MNINEIASHFDFEGRLLCVREFGSGHINSTYIAEHEDKSYVLQKINHHVFKDVDGLMENVFAVTDYLRTRIAKEGGDAERETLHFIRTRDGKKFYQTPDGAYYRAYVFVKDSICYDSADTPALFKKSGEAFGRFQRRLKDFPAETLFETIPHFHDTAWRYENEFLPAVKRAEEETKKRCASEIEFVNERKEILGRLYDFIQKGRIPLRVTHNDTKLNNILFDKKTGESLAVIDLDTVMPGSSLFDFGDSIRFGASASSESEQDLSSVHCRLDYFKAYAEGFLKEAGGALNECERDNLAFSAVTITLELGMRFLTDYMNGNTYFKIDYAEQNLDRARNQFKLVEDMERKLEEMNGIIKSLS